MNVKDIQEIRQILVRAIEIIDEYERTPVTANDQIIGYREVAELLEEVLGKPHRLSSFHDFHAGGSRAEIICCLPDNFSNDTMYGPFETKSMDNTIDELLDDYLYGIRPEYDFYDIECVLEFLASKSKILYGTYIIEVSW